MAVSPPSSVAISMLQLSKLMREICPPTPADKSERIMADLEKVLAQPRGISDSTKAFLEQIMNLMSRHLDFSELAAATKDSNSELFRYVAFMGMRKEAENAYRKLSYDMSDTTNATSYPKIKCTSSVDFFPAELRPEREGELETFNRPTLLGMQRTSLEMLQEGDYFCAFFYGQRGDLLGWFELARTRDGKIPSGNNLKWLSMICAVVGKVLG
jgi:hypothetical protein